MRWQFPHLHVTDCDSDTAVAHCHSSSPYRLCSQHRSPNVNPAVMLAPNMSHHLPIISPPALPVEALEAPTGQSTEESNTNQSTASHHGEKRCQNAPGRPTRSQQLNQCFFLLGPPASVGLWHLNLLTYVGTVRRTVRGKGWSLSPMMRWSSRGMPPGPPDGGCATCPTGGPSELVDDTKIGF